MGTATGSYPLQDYPVAKLEKRRDSSLTVASRFGEKPVESSKFKVQTRRKAAKNSGGSARASERNKGLSCYQVCFLLLTNANESREVHCHLA